MSGASDAPPGDDWMEKCEKSLLGIPFCNKVIYDNTSLRSDTGRQMAIGIARVISAEPSLVMYSLCIAEHHHGHSCGQYTPYTQGRQGECANAVDCLLRDGSIQSGLPSSGLATHQPSPIEPLTTGPNLATVPDKGGLGRCRH